MLRLTHALWEARGLRSRALAIALYALFLLLFSFVVGCAALQAPSRAWDPAALLLLDAAPRLLAWSLLAGLHFGLHLCMELDNFSAICVAALCVAARLGATARRRVAAGPPRAKAEAQLGRECAWRSTCSGCSRRELTSG